jgi:hypothetical protein
MRSSIGPISGFLNEITQETSGANAKCAAEVVGPGSGKRLHVAWVHGSYTTTGAGALQLCEEYASVSGESLQLTDGTGAGGADLLTRITGDFTVDGVVAGDYVTTLGFTTTNNATWIVTVVAAKILTITDLAGASVATNETKATGASAAEYTERTRFNISATATPLVPVNLSTSSDDKGVLLVLAASGVGGSIGQINALVV